MKTFQFDQQLQPRKVKKITRHGTRVRGIEYKNPVWYGAPIHRVPEDPTCVREEVEK